jgi:hypothetical protein
MVYLMGPDQKRINTIIFKELVNGVFAEESGAYLNTAIQKIILPFCTHEGSGMGRSEEDIRRLCPTANVKNGIAIRCANVHMAEKDIAVLISTTGGIN